ncbi:MAG TPA: extracellular solute-binding protein [Actinophytocola sp.]|uniref:ABC transporter substrate-binding protein n=1 Tax=Actinophytocola sp. TaxID=1872138 RepID=UPI002DDDA490|nr:extracellular solute-binding protein [Actinophytocola sp.]HEV2781141.1 extracellular solute-binding protein [Actinophytocola sp.]
MLIALVLALAGCGGVGNDPSGDAGGKASLTTMGFGLPDEHATARVDVYRKAHPDVDIRINEGNFDEQQFLSALASGSPPDLIYLDRNKLGSFAARAAVQPIDDCVKRRNVDMSQFRQGTVEQVTFDGKLYGLPEFAQVRLLIMSNTVLREAGLAPDQLSTSDWSALADAAKRLAKVTGGRVERIGFDPKVPEFLPLWAKANGVDLVGDDGKTVRLNDPKTVEAVRFTTDLVAEQGGWSQFKAFKDGFDMLGARNQYVTGQLAAMPIESWYINTLAANSPDVDVTVLPFTDRSGTPVTTAGGQAWAIPKGAPHPEQACDFMVTMTATDTWVTAAKARRDALAKQNKPYSGTYTANRAADEKIFAEVYDGQSNKIIDAGVRVALSLQDKVFAWPANPAGAELLKVWESAVNRVLLGQQSPEQAMQQAQQEADTAIQRAGR